MEVRIYGYNDNDSKFVQLTRNYYDENYFNQLIQDNDLNK